MSTEPISQSLLLMLKRIVDKFGLMLGDVVINTVNSPYYDLLIVVESASLKFGIKAFGLPKYQSDLYCSYIQALQTCADEIALPPIVLAIVDENSDDVLVGSLMSLSWRDHRRVYPLPMLKNISEIDKTLFIDNIRSLDTSVVNPLDVEHWYVLKTIEVTTSDYAERREVIQIMYLRQLTENYAMQRIVAKTQQERFRQLCGGYTQEEYPSDILDEVIADGIMQLYTRSNVEITNSLVTCNTELRNLRDNIRGTMARYAVYIDFHPDVITYYYQQNIHVNTLTLEAYQVIGYSGNNYNDKWTIISLSHPYWNTFDTAYKYNLDTLRLPSQILL